MKNSTPGQDLHMTAASNYKSASAMKPANAMFVLGQSIAENIQHPSLQPKHQSRPTAEWGCKFKTKNKTYRQVGGGLSEHGKEVYNISLS